MADKIYSKGSQSAKATALDSMRNSDYDLRNLNYMRLKRKLILSSWRFFGFSIMYIMFFIFPRHKWAPYLAQEGLPLNGTAVIVGQHHAWSYVEWDQALFLDTEALFTIMELSNSTNCFASSNHWAELTAGWGGQSFDESHFIRLKEMIGQLSLLGAFSWLEYTNDPVVWEVVQDVLSQTAKNLTARYSV